MPRRHAKPVRARAAVVPATERRPSIAAWPFFCAGLVYLALLLFPVDYQAVGQGLDASWAFALNHFVNTQYRFGPDLVFTYGPLGFVAEPQNVGHNLAIALTFRFALWALLLWQLAAMWRSGMRAPAAVLLVSLIVSNKVYYWYWDYLLEAVFLVCLVRILHHPPGWFDMAAIAAVAGVSFLVKFTGFVMVAVLLAVYACIVFTARRHRARREYGLCLLAAAAGPVAYLLYNPSLRGLIDYVRGVLQIASGYAVSMSLDTDPASARLALAVCLILAGCVAHAVLSRRLAPLRALLVAVLAWTAFRHGFVRSSADQSPVFFAFSILVFGFLLAQIPLDARRLAGYAPAWLAFAGTALYGVDARWHPAEADWWSPKMSLVKARAVLDPPRLAAMLDAVRGQSWEATAMPRYAPVVKGSRVVVFPWDVSYDAHGAFDLFPLYSTQAYTCYTRYLDGKTAAKIRAADPPVRYVVFEWKTIDGRHPITDSPATWAVLYSGYAPRSAGHGAFLLERRTRPLDLTYTPAGSAPYRFGAWVSLPRRETPLALSIDLAPTPAGRVLAGIYKIAPVFMDLRTLSGDMATFRVPVDVLAAPFPANALPLSAEALAEMWNSGRVADPVEAVRLRGAGLAHYSAREYRFYDLGGTGITLPATVARETLEQRFHLDSPGRIADPLEGFIDRMNGAAPSGLNTPVSAARVAADEGVTLEGWVAAADPAGKTAVDEVYAVVSGTLVKARALPRQDVADYFHNPRLAGCGYRVHLGPGVLRAGVQPVVLIGYRRATGKLYRLPVVLYVSVSPAGGN